MELSSTAMVHRSSTRLVPMKFAIRMRAMQCPAYCALAVPNTRTPLSLSDPDLHIARVQMDRGEGAKSKATLPSRVLVSHLSRLRLLSIPTDSSHRFGSGSIQHSCHPCLLSSSAYMNLHLYNRVRMTANARQRKGVGIPSLRRRLRNARKPRANATSN